MNFMFRLIMTFNATSWMLLIYLIKNRITILSIPYIIFHLTLIIIILILSWLTLYLSRKFGQESIHDCREIILADNEFLPVYLGYFFVSLSISNHYTMIILFLLVFIFTYISRTQYFNPSFLFLGYHFYHVYTLKGTRIFVIKQGKIIRRKEDMKLNNLRRINDTTFIERR